MTKQEPVPEDIIELVRPKFASKRDVIVSHSKPWTPWALSQLLEIDDTHTAQPAEIILYTALKTPAPNRIGIADSVIKEVFVDQDHAGKIPFLDGQRWSPKVHIR